MGAVGGQQRLAATPAARAAAVQSLLLAQRVLMLDDVWTMEVERATGRAHELTESDIEVLEGHVRHLQRSLEETPMRARELRLVLEEMTGDDVDAGLAAFADSPATPPDLVARVERSLPDYDLRSAAIEACDYLIEEVEEDIRLLEQQLHTLRAEQLPPGDIRLTSRCAFHLLLSGAGIAFAVASGGAAALVGLGVVVGVGQGVYGWEDARCPRVLPQIGRHRR